MTLKELITKLNELAISNPELLTEQVSILEPEYGCGYEVCEIEQSYINNTNGTVFSLEELTEEFDENEIEAWKKSVIIKGR